jgi:hypothetical protein
MLSNTHEESRRLFLGIKTEDEARAAEFGAGRVIADQRVDRSVRLPGR